MKISKKKLKRIIFEEAQKLNEMNLPTALSAKRDEGGCAIAVKSAEPAEYVELPSEVEAAGSLEGILEDLRGLLTSWPACQEHPNSWACKYHKDLEEVVNKYSYGEQ